MACTDKEWFELKFKEMEGRIVRLHQKTRKEIADLKHRTDRIEVFVTGRLE